MCHHRYVGTLRQRGGEYGIFTTRPVGCHGTHPGWGDVGHPGPLSRVWLPSSDTGPRRRGVVRRRAAVYGSGIGRAPCLAERKLRPPGTGGFLPRPRRSSGPYLGRRALLGGELDPRGIPDSGGLHRHDVGLRALRRRHAAGEGVTTVVWRGSYRVHARFAALGDVLWDRVVRSDPDSVGLRAVVAEGSRYRAALARKVNPHEEAHPARASNVASTRARPTNRGAAMSLP